jgi:UDP-N-acetylglucosamine/UDP-N-acetylgalactosamine diphosphorylase
MDIAALRKEYAELGQDHVFRFWERLDPEAQARLAEQADSLDLPRIVRGYRATQEPMSAAPPKLEPIDVIPTLERSGDTARFAAARERGEAMLAAGRVGVMVVAGGQATRLGYPGPKGCFPIGPLSERSLFELQAQKLRRLRAHCGQPVPWYVMTSEATDEATRRFFIENDYFGLPEGDIFFLCQRMVPSFDFEGKLILERPDRIFQNPDGHGGSLTALLESGALDDMAQRGIDTLFYYQVDNPLIRMADPLFLGFHAELEAEISTKVVRKQDPDEKVGIVARVDGKPGVVEYTEIDDEHRFARDAAGELVYWSGNAAIHVFDTAFLRHVAEQADTLLPFHASAKKIPYAADDGATVTPEEPNGHKLERFVFDALSAATRTAVVETTRAEEYSPVKNRSGDESPETSRRDLVARARAWLEAAGIALPHGSIELDHARIDGPEDAKALGIVDPTEAPDTIRLDPGEPA